MHPETITISQHAGTWYAKSDDPKIVELFGTDTLPTAYTTQSATTVAELLLALRPIRTIIINEG